MTSAAPSLLARGAKVVACAIAAAALMAPCGLCTAWAATKLRIGFGTALDGPAGEGIKKMAEIVKTRTNGELELEIFPNNQLGAEPEMMAQVRSGNLDLAMLGNGVVSALEPTVGVMDLPFIFKSRESFWKVASGPTGQKLLDRVSAKGVKALAWGSWGQRSFINVGFQINGPQDMKGRKIRVAPSDLYVKTIQSFGGNPAVVTWNEVYMALQQKTVDSVESSAFAFVEAKLNEVATSLAVTDHLIVASMFLMNGPRFDALKPEHKQVVIDAAREGGNVMQRAINKTNDDAIALLQTKGVTITRPDRAAFEKLVKPVYDFFTPKLGAALIDEVRAAQQ